MRACRFLIVVVLAAGAVLAGCASPVETADHGDEEPAHVEHLDGSELGLVTLTERAAQRLGIQTATVVAANDRLIVPYGAVFWDAGGAAWAYVEREPLAYQRHPLTIETIDGDEAVLTAGPAAGATVVSVGTVELIGTEFEVGH